MDLHRFCSGQVLMLGGITKAGDVNLRRALCQAATVMMQRGRSTWLRTWAAQVARRRGAKRAMVALARRIGVILHRMWIDDTDFRFEITVPHAARRFDLPRVACLTAGLRGPPRDAVPMMSWSGLLPIQIEHANEMGTSELH